MAVVEISSDDLGSLLDMAYWANQLPSRDSHGILRALGDDLNHERRLELRSQIASAEMKVA